MIFYRCISVSVLIIFSIILLSCENVIKESHLKKEFENAAIVSAHPLATNAGLEILKNGGNAFDAAVCVHFALAVVYPHAGNIAGGGFAVILDSKGEKYSLDFRETAPAQASRDMYLDSAGKVIKGMSTEGALAVGVPGSVMGMWQLHQRFGSMNWKELIQPAIDIARNGWELTEKEATKLSKNRDKILKVSKVNNYLTLQTAYKKGDSLRNENLAKTLEIIRDKGYEAFYKGEIANSIESCMIRNGGILSKKDLENYEVKWREPLTTNYRGYEVISMPPPSSGGWALMSILKMLDNYPVKDWGKWDIRSLHVITEIEKRAYADRSKYLGDVDFYDVPMEKLLSDSFLDYRCSDISLDSTMPSKFVNPGLEAFEESTETTHFSIADEEGNAVSITTTLNARYGSKLVVEGMGFLLNNQMNDFAIKPGHPNIYGLTGAEANSIAPRKRMLSSMTPTILAKNNKPILIIGSPGGSKIITAVMQNILNVVEYDYGIQESIELPRLHHQWLPDSLFYEQGLFDFVDSMKFVKLGHAMSKSSLELGRVDALHLNSNGNWECGADPRGDDFGYGY